MNGRVTLWLLLLWVLLWWAGGIGPATPSRADAPVWRAGDVLHCRGLDLNKVVCRREVR